MNELPIIIFLTLFGAIFSLLVKLLVGVVTLSIKLVAWTVKSLYRLTFLCRSCVKQQINSEAYPRTTVRSKKLP